MYREVRDDVAHWAEQIRTRDLLRTQCDALRRHHAKLLAELDAARQRVEVERGDVERLEEKTFERLFARLRGRLDVRLEDERAKLLEAELRHTELLQLEEAGRDEIASVEQEIAVLGPVEEHHTRAFRDKAAVILAGDDDLARTVSAIIDRITTVQAFDFELGQATQAGRNVIASLDAALRLLSSIAEPPSGLGLLTQFEDENDRARRLDRAARATSAVKLALVRFQSELHDVQRQIEVPDELDTFTRFARKALNSQFPDWYLARIAQQGRHDLMGLRGQVEQAIAAVQQQHAANTKRLDAEWAAYQSAVSMG